MSPVVQDLRGPMILAAELARNEQTQSRAQRVCTPQAQGAWSLSAAAVFAATVDERARLPVPGAPDKLLSVCSSCKEIPSVMRRTVLCEKRSTSGMVAAARKKIAGDSIAIFRGAFAWWTRVIFESSLLDPPAPLASAGPRSSMPLFALASGGPQRERLLPRRFPLTSRSGAETCGWICGT